MKPKLHQFTWRQLGKRQHHEQGLELAILKQKRWDFMVAHAGEDALTTAKAAKAAGLYRKSTNDRDIAATINRLRARGKLT